MPGWGGNRYHNNGYHQHHPQPYHEQQQWQAERQESSEPPAPEGQEGFVRISKRVFVVPQGTTANAAVEELNEVHDQGLSEKNAIPLDPAQWEDETEFASQINKVFRVKGGKAGPKFWKGVREAVMKLCGTQDVVCIIAVSTLAAAEQVQALLKNLFEAAETKAVADQLVGLKSGKVVAVLPGWDVDEVKAWPLVADDPIPPPPSREELARRNDPDDVSQYYAQYRQAAPRQVPPRQRQVFGHVGGGSRGWGNGGLAWGGQQPAPPQRWGGDGSYGGGSGGGGGYGGYGGAIDPNTGYPYDNAAGYGQYNGSYSSDPAGYGAMQQHQTGMGQLQGQQPAGGPYGAMGVGQPQQPPPPPPPPRIAQHGGMGGYANGSMAGPGCQGSSIGGAYGGTQGSNWNGSAHGLQAQQQPQPPAPGFGGNGFNTCSGGNGGVGGMSLMQRTQNAEAELLFQQMNGGSRTNGSGGPGGALPGQPPGGGSAFPAGLEATVSQFGMSAKAPAFTPGGAMSSCGASATATSNGISPHASFEQESLRAVMNQAPPSLFSKYVSVEPHCLQCILPACTLQAAENLWAGTSRTCGQAPQPSAPATAAMAPRFQVPDLNKVPSLQAIEAESMRAAAAGLFDGAGFGAGGGASSGVAGGDDAVVDGLGMPQLPSGMLGGDLLASLSLNSPGNGGGRGSALGGSG